MGKGPNQRPTVRRFETENLAHTLPAMLIDLERTNEVPKNEEQKLRDRKPKSGGI